MSTVEDHPKKDPPAPKYYPCYDPNRPVCRDFVNKGKCWRQTRCKFYHPRVITPVARREGRRELGKCYCGADLRTILRDHGVAGAEFFVVCSRTNRSIHRC